MVVYLNTQYKNLFAVRGSSIIDTLYYMMLASTIEQNLCKKRNGDMQEITMPGCELFDTDKFYETAEYRYIRSGTAAIIHHGTDIIVASLDDVCPDETDDDDFDSKGSLGQI